MPEIAVDVHHLTRTFGKFRAVDDISFRVDAGEVFGFLGPNGAGKSTTIRMLCGLLAPSGGNGSVAGFDIGRQPERIKQNIGYMSQRFSLYDDLTVNENITFYAGIYGVTGDRLVERRRWILEMAGLMDRADSITAELSTRWKQRLALGTAVVHNPPIVFLDEPTSGVDPISRRSFWDLIGDLAESGITVFVTTHFMDEAEHCNRLAMIYRGQMIATGSPAELKAGFAGGTLVEAHATPLMEALSALDGAPYMADAALFGDTVHVAVQGAGDAEATVRSALQTRQVHIDAIRRIQPSLEDVFVSLTEQADRMRPNGGQ